MKASDFSILIENLLENEVNLLLQDTRLDFDPRSDSFLKEYSKKLAKFANFVTMRASDNTICGIIAFYANIIPNAFITHVWVSPNLRGMGFYGEMMKQIDQYCTSKGFTNISLEVRTNNPSAIIAYEKCGFKIISSTDMIHQMTKVLK